MQNDFDVGWRQRALCGDAGAVRKLTGAVLEPLFRFCLYRVSRNRHLCEEVVQETLMRALADLEKYDPERAGGNIFPWLAGLARNEIQRVLSREKSLSLETLWARMDRELLVVYARLESEPATEELLRREETRELVNAAMSQLPPQYQAALQAKYVNGQSVRDLAFVWHTSEKAVESRLSRARAAFRSTFLALAKNLGMEPG